MRNIRNTIYEPAVLLYSILFLFFFQLISDFVATIYAFGLLGTGIPLEIVFVLLLFSPLLLLIPRGGLSSRWLLVLAFVILLARSIEILLATNYRLLVSGIGVGAFLVYFPSLLGNLGEARRGAQVVDLSAGLALAVLFSALFRALGSGVDLTIDGGAPWAGWLLAILAAILLYRLFERNSPPAPSASTEENPPVKASSGRVVPLSLGISGIFTMLYFGFTAPNVLARWAEAPYLLVLLAFFLALVAFVFINLMPGGLMGGIPRLLVLAWNITFVIALVVTIFLNQLSFPDDPLAYPFYEISLGVAGYLPLIITILIFSILFLDFLLFCRELVILRPSSRQLASGFSYGSLYMIVMILAHVFTTTYDYIPVIGPFFRDKFWLVYLVAGAVPALMLFALRKAESEPGRRYSPSFLTLVVVLGLVGMLGAYLVAAQPEEFFQPSDGLRVMTYNIQQGYDKDGMKNYEGQLELIHAVDPDVLGLQESDTNRIANSNDDLVRYFADKLDMYTYYGPEVVQGTFGIALLSKYPLLNPQTFYMYSQGEQTATITAQIEVGSKQYNLLVTHLGNDGPLIQQEAILAEAVGLENIILMGDFNFRPASEQYKRTVAILDDAWLRMWPDGDDGSGIDPDERIDHIFISPYLILQDARFLAQPESDHPALFAVFE